MKNIFRWLGIYLLNKSLKKSEINNKYCTMSIRKRFILIKTPNGEVIHCQRDLTIINNISDKYMCQCTASFIVPISNIVIEDED